VLLRIMADPQVPPAVRVQAASRVLEFSLRGVEFSELERRLTELERTRELVPNGLDTTEDAEIVNES